MSVGPARTSCNRPCTIWPLSVTGGIASPQVISVSRDARHNVIVLTLRVTRKRAWAVPWKLLVLAVETVAGVPFYIRKPFNLGEQFPSFSIYLGTIMPFLQTQSEVESGIHVKGSLCWKMELWVKLIVEYHPKKVEFSSRLWQVVAWKSWIYSLHESWLDHQVPSSCATVSQPFPVSLNSEPVRLGAFLQHVPSLEWHRLTWSMTTAIQRRSNAMKKVDADDWKTRFVFFCLFGSWTMVLGSAWNNLNLKAIRQSPGVFYAAPLMARRGGAFFFSWPQNQPFFNMEFLTHHWVG